MNVYNILIMLSLLVIVSYLFDLLARKMHFPSVLLLLFTGVGLRYGSQYFHLEVPYLQPLLQFLGVLGLIFIVLEGALDLKLSRDKLPLIRKSFLSALLLFSLSAMAIAAILRSFLQVPFYQALVNAIPMAVISSAIAIPSVAVLNEQKREFLVYEATFSDIIGILVFNYCVMDQAWGWDYAFSVLTGIAGVIILSAVSSLLLILLIDRLRLHIKFFLLLSGLVLVYASGKILHLSTLLLILTFGLLLGNSRIFIRGKLEKYFDSRRLRRELRLLKVITAESAFLIRTFFFILFGFSMKIETMLGSRVFMLGGLIVFILVGVRYLYLRYLARTELMPELLVAPRGLVTILLFYSIPQHLVIPGFSEAILFLVILLTSCLMMAGIIAVKNKREELISKIN